MGKGGLVKEENRKKGSFNYAICDFVHGSKHFGPILFDHATINWDYDGEVSIKSGNDYFYLNDKKPLQARVQLSDGGYITATAGNMIIYIIEYPNGDKFHGLPSNRVSQRELASRYQSYQEFMEFMLTLKNYKSIDFMPWDGSMNYASGMRDNFKNGESMNMKQATKERIAREEAEKAEKEEQARLAREAAEKEARIKLQEQERINEERAKQAKHNRLVKKYGASIAKEIEAGKVRIGTSEAVLKEGHWFLISENSNTRIYAVYGRVVGTQYYPDLIRTRVVCRNGKVIQIDRY